MLASMDRLVRVYFVIQSNKHNSSVVLALVPVKRRRHRAQKGSDHRHSGEKVVGKIGKKLSTGSSHGRMCREAGTADSCGLRAFVRRAASYTARSVLQDGSRRSPQALRLA